MSETHTVDTAYGTTEIETYECDSCGTRVAYDNTVPFTIGSSEGRACEYCEENGPISFPRKTLDFAYPVITKNNEKWGLLFHTVFMPIVLPISTIAGFRSDALEFQIGYATAVVSLLVWFGVPALAWFLSL